MPAQRYRKGYKLTNLKKTLWDFIQKVWICSTIKGLLKTSTDLLFTPMFARVSKQKTEHSSQGGLGRDECIRMHFPASSISASPRQGSLMMLSAAPSWMCLSSGWALQLPLVWAANRSEKQSPWASHSIQQSQEHIAGSVFSDLAYRLYDKKWIRAPSKHIQPDTD